MYCRNPIGAVGSLLEVSEARYEEAESDAVEEADREVCLCVGETARVVSADNKEAPDPAVTDECEADRESQEG